MQTHTWTNTTCWQRQTDQGWTDGHQYKKLSIKQFYTVTPTDTSNIVQLQFQFPLHGRLDENISDAEAIIRCTVQPTLLDGAKLSWESKWQYVLKMSLWYWIQKLWESFEIVRWQVTPSLPQGEGRKNQSSHLCSLNGITILTESCCLLPNFRETHRHTDKVRRKRDG